MGSHLFFMSKEGAVMFWGGDYCRPVSVSQQRRAVQMNTRIVSNLDRGQVKNDQLPMFEFRVASGVALKSRYVKERVKEGRNE